jgi:hypothetical protein
MKRKYIKKAAQKGCRFIAPQTIQTRIRGLKALFFERFGFSIYSVLRGYAVP